MLNTLLFVHLIIAALLVVVILLQKTSTDGLSGIGGGGNNMGIMRRLPSKYFFRCRSEFKLLHLLFQTSINGELPSERTGVF